MFATFSATPESSSYEVGSPTSLTPRPKRHQVARACVWCRTYRIKCDASYPCRNCKAKGRKCTAEKGKEDVRTFPLAIKEIDRLKERVKELEEKLKNLPSEAQGSSRNAEPIPAKLTVALPVNLDPLAQHGGNRKYYNWDNISTRTARANQQCYGASSSFYFIGQMTSYLDRVLQQRHSDIQPTSASRCYSSPITAETTSSAQSPTVQDRSTIELDLSRAEEEVFLELYWQSYHSIYPVLDEAEFKSHYASLWTTSGPTRQPSALVDMVLALCMQYGAALPPPNRMVPISRISDATDATIAGRWFHRRGQYLLTDELEGPSITTFQCYLLSVIWLSNASFQNMAHSIMAAGIRVGNILGLHLEPPEELPKHQREVRNRLWWTMYTLEMKFAMELGRPLAINFSQVTCSLPGDGSELSSTVSKDTARAMSFNAHLVRLVLATRAIYITFYRKCGEVLGKSGYKSLYHDPQSLESLAEFLQPKVEYLYTWLQQVPDTLRPQRQHLGQPFSTDRSALDIRSQGDIRLARQGILLELLYHNLSMNLYRPFICFTRGNGPSNTVSEIHAISCVNHAITITSIIRQVLMESELLGGWHEAFQWQWNATLSLIGYILAHPVGPTAPVARKALGTAIDVFDHLSVSFSSAFSAASVTRDLATKADLLIEKSRASLVLGSTHAFPPLHGLTTLSEIDSAETGEFELGDVANSGILGRPTSEVFQNTLISSSGFAFTLDSFSGLEDIGTDGGMMFDFLDFSGIE